MLNETVGVVRSRTTEGLTSTQARSASSFSNTPACRLPVRALSKAKKCPWGETKGDVRSRTADGLTLINARSASPYARYMCFKRSCIKQLV